jgi:hypothetical protein
LSNYVEDIIKKYKHPIGLDTTTKNTVFDPLETLIRKWAFNNNLSLADIKLSGSRAKGTAISLSTDLDMFISLSSSNTTSLKDIYNSLFDYFNQPGFYCRKQNVSIRVTYNGKYVDIVPSRRQSQYGGDHSLYKRKQDSWMQTDVDKHINIVKNSNRIEEIAAAKIWRYRHNLDFSSIFLELVTIEATKNMGTTDHDSNFLYFLNFIRDNIQSVKIVDPANTNNVISDDLTIAEKKVLSDQARKSRNEQYWKDIIW